MFKNASGVLAAVWSNALHSSTDHACDPPEALSWKEIGLPPRRNCHNSPPIEVGVLSSFKIKWILHIPVYLQSPIIDEPFSIIKLFAEQKSCLEHSVLLFTYH